MLQYDSLITERDGEEEENVWEKNNNKIII
jgi:hypothetical protein